MKILVNDKNELIITTGEFVKHECVVKSKDGDIHLLEWLNIKVIDNNTVSINDKEYKVDDLVITSMKQVSEEFIKSDSIYLKSMVDCLPEDDDKYPLLYKVAIRAMKMSTPVPLTQAQHNKKLATIRELVHIGSGTKVSMSTGKLKELLSYYGLELKDLLREEYL